MKPRTKLEIMVAGLSDALPAITKKQEDWAITHVFQPFGYKCLDEVWCTNCGKKFPILGKIDTTECPHCHKMLIIKKSRAKKYDEYGYCTIVTTKKGFQVFRHLLVHKFISHLCKEGMIRRDEWVREVCQEWVTPDGRRLTIARPINMYGGWMYYEKMSLKNENRTYSYTIYGTVYPAVRLTSELKRRGLNKKILDMVLPSGVARSLLTDPQTEFLVKTKQYGLLKYKNDRCWYELRCNHVLKICARNHYIVDDGSLYMDYIDRLFELGKDTHNAHYVCPNNLKEAHDEVMKRIIKKRRKEDLERLKNERIDNMRRLRDSIRAFYHDKSRFFGLFISGDGITIRPLESITQYYLEGMKMHHCVYESQYYNDNSLILSARDSEGKRLETIEVDLDSYNVVQSRAVCNGITAQHDRIIELVESNINLIKKRAS